MQPTPIPPAVVPENVYAAWIFYLQRMINGLNQTKARQYQSDHADWEENKPLYVAENLPVPPEPMPPVRLILTGSSTYPNVAQVVYDPTGEMVCPPVQPVPVTPPDPTPRLGPVMDPAQGLYSVPPGDEAPDCFILTDVTTGYTYLKHVTQQPTGIVQWYALQK